MSLPVRHLPVLQNWDCHACGDCCREYDVPVSDEERRRILAQEWEKDAEVGTVSLFVHQGPWWARRYLLNHRADGSCVFLSKEGRCRIHERFGAAAKPLTCRIYPFVLVPVGDHLRVSLRFACPSAGANKGRPLTEHGAGLRSYAAELERSLHLDFSRADPPLLQRKQRVDWPDLFRFVQALLDLVENRRDPVERRLRKCLALSRLCRQGRFDQVKGGRLVEFLKVIGESLDGEVTADPAQVPPPTWIGRVLFRRALAIFARKDQGPNRGSITGGWGLAQAAWRFTLREGTVPRLHGWLPQDLTFADVERPAGPLPPDAERALERYYAVKIESLQFCGSSNFGMSFWEGLEALVLTLAIILWLCRALRDVSRKEAVIRAIGMVDNSFGFNRRLRIQRYSLGVMARRGELEKLVAWYSR